MSQEQQITREGLKIQALKERLAEVEDINAEYRVEITILTQRLQEALATIEGHDVQEESPSDEPLADDTAE